MRRLYSSSILLAAVLILLVLSGCIIQTTSVTFSFNQAVKPQQVYVRYSDGTFSNGSSDIAQTSVTLATYSSKEIVGGFLYDGKVSWVPQYSYSFSPTGNTVSVNIDPSQVPSKPAHHAKLESVSADPVQQGSVSVTYSVYGADNQPVDDRIEVFALSAGTTFYNNDPNENTSYPGRINTVMGGFSSFTVDGKVTFVIQSTVDDFSNLKFSLYSGPTFIYDSVLESGAIGYAPGDSAISVTKNVTLPTAGANDSSISWESDHPEVISSSGVVTPPSSPGDVNVTVTGTVCDSSDNFLSKAFDLVVKGPHLVTFNLNDGLGGKDIQTVKLGDTATEPSAPTRAGYTFGGWYTDSNLTTPFAFTTAITGNVTLYAKWTAVPSSPPSPPSTPAKEDKVTSADGKLTLPAGQKGEVSLDDAVTVLIPSDATEKELKITIEKLADTQNLLVKKEVLVSSVYEILKNFSENFNNPVTLTFKFDPSSLKNNEKPVVFYYDETKKEWVKVGGTVDGSRITVDVNHFTKYAVFAVADAETPAAGGQTDPATQANFSDISGHWAEANIKKAVSGRFVTGYPDGTFKPEKTVTRAEFAVMLMNALKPQGEGAALTFTDKAKIGSWAQKAVAQSVQASITSGYKDGSFRPNAEITRAEMAAMIAKALGLTADPKAATGFPDDAKIPAWAKGAVAELKQLGIIGGKGANAYDPAGKTTRAEAVTVLLNMLAQMNK